MADWDAQQYLKFGNERTRAARDLLAQVAISDARSIVDLGCGPGNSTELLVQRWPEASVLGVDTSAEMLRKARELLPQQRFIEANIAHWAPQKPVDLIFANAVFQWVPNHVKHLKRLMASLNDGGVLAVQMPDNIDEPSHVAMREVAFLPQWREEMVPVIATRDSLPSAQDYYNELQPHCGSIDIWTTTYNHVLESTDAIVEWVKGTGLRPFVDRLEGPRRREFLTIYAERIRNSYVTQADGKVLLRFPRLFMVLTR